MTTTSTRRTSFPTLRYLAAPFRWVLQTRGRLLAAAGVLLAILLAPPLWWSIQLVGLPDVGEPFDREAFRSFTIPDDRNAYVFYRQAAASLKPSVRSEDFSTGRVGPVPKDDVEARRWVEENRQAMALYRRGTERPDALDLAPPFSGESFGLLRDLQSFHALAELEAGRLEKEGDMAGAWGWYRAALRATYHIGLHGTITARSIAHRWHAEIEGRLASWASDPRTTPANLRQALDDVVALGSLTPSESYTIKVEYPQLQSMLDSPQNPGRYVPVMRLGMFLRSPDHVLSPELMRAISDAWRFWRREPERSHRVIRLVVANWLAYHDLPPERRPAPDPRPSGSFDFYAFGPEAPANARALSPAALDRWLASTNDALELLRGIGIQSIQMQEQTAHGSTVVLLASRLYRLERGTDPPSEQALVGPYLNELPDDGSGEARRKGGAQRPR